MKESVVDSVKNGLRGGAVRKDAEISQSPKEDLKIQPLKLRDILYSRYHHDGKLSMGGMTGGLAKLPVPKQQSALISLQRTHGNRFVQKMAVQAKFTVGPANDKYEQESERDAGHAFNMPEPAILKRQAGPDPEEEELLQAKFLPVQRMNEEEETQLHGRIGLNALTAEQAKTEPNRTGLPDALKAGIENLSGISLDDIQVHYSSSKPAQLQALAYTQGTDIHVSPGEERHLSHEAWHAVQQKQGRVKPIFQVRGYNINDDTNLEEEANVMAANALQLVPTTNVRSHFYSIPKQRTKKEDTALLDIKQKKSKALAGNVVQLQFWDYINAVGSSLFWYLKSVIFDFPIHIWRLIKHCTIGVGVTIFDMGIELITAVAEGFRGNWSSAALHLAKLIQNGLAWPFRLVSKILDLVGFGEAMDLIMQIIKFNIRPLDNAEIVAAQTVFGNKINYSQVRVDEFSLLNTYAFRFWLAFTAWHAINWPHGSSFLTDPGTFIHELTHVWQMERRGMQYIAEAPIHGGITGGGYIYAVDRNPFNDANGAQLAADRANGKTIWDFNLEQQAEICRHYYERFSAGRAVANWQLYIDDIQGVNNMPLRTWIREPAFLPHS